MSGRERGPKTVRRQSRVCPSRRALRSWAYSHRYHFLRPSYACEAEEEEPWLCVLRVRSRSDTSASKKSRAARLCRPQAPRSSGSAIPKGRSKKEANTALGGGEG